MVSSRDCRIEPLSALGFETIEWCVHRRFFACIKRLAVLYFHDQNRFDVSLIVEWGRLVPSNAALRFSPRNLK